VSNKAFMALTLDVSPEPGTSASVRWGQALTWDIVFAKFSLPEILGVTSSSAAAKAYRRLQSKLDAEASLPAGLEAVTSLLSHVKA
jgi:hypothetical protein